MKVGILVQDAHGNPPEMWLLEELKNWGDFLVNNVDPGDKMTVTYREFSDEEIEIAMIAGKAEAGEELTDAEKEVLGIS